MIDPWVAVSGLTGLLASGGLVWLREALTVRRVGVAREQERARLEGELVATLRTHGGKLDRIQHRLDRLPCIDCRPKKGSADGSRPIAAGA